MVEWSNGKTTNQMYGSVGRKNSDPLFLRQLEDSTPSQIMDTRKSPTGKAKLTFNHFACGIGLTRTHPAAVDFIRNWLYTVRHTNDSAAGITGSQSAGNR
jgi:hypothetical protein